MFQFIFDEIKMFKYAYEMKEKYTVHKAQNPAMDVAIL